MNGVDIGTLSGRIEFEDKISTTMETVLAKVEKMEAGFGGMDTSVRSVAGGFILAEAAMAVFDKVLDVTIGLVEDFTTKGAGIADVEENFDRLAEGAGRAGETMLGVLREGTHNTIDDFTLMKTVNDQFAAGIQLTDQQMKTLAEGGFALAQAKGIDVADAFDTLNNAMLTGQVRQVQMLTGKIDLAKAEEEYAKTLGTTTERLTAQERQEAARLAILEKVTEATNRLGEQTDGVDEILAQVQTAWNNFYDDLIKGVAASPSVVNAFLSIRDALFETFGGTEQVTATFIDAINDIADWVADNAPGIIAWFGKVRDGAVELWGKATKAWEDYGPIIVTAFNTMIDMGVKLYNMVISTWDALPDWMKRVAERSAIAATGLYLVAAGADAAAGSILDTSASIATITSGFASIPDLLSKVNAGLGTMKVLWAVMDFSSVGDAVASVKLLGGSIAGMIGPLGIAAAYAVALFAAFELGKTEAISDWFMELGLELQGYSQAEQDAMIATDKAMQAQRAKGEATKESADVLALLEEVQAKVNEQLVVATDSTNALGEAQAVTNERTKEFALAWEALERLGTTYEDTLKGVNENIRASVMEYANLGATVEDLYQAFPKLTKAQAEAAVESVKAAKEIRAVNDETFGIMAKAHGDNINDWIEGERRKLAATLESLQLQGKLTDEMLNAQMAKFDATIDAEISKRNEGNQASRDYYQKQVDDAQNAYDLIMADTSRYTDAQIRESRRLLEERKRDLEHWTSIANGAAEAQTAKLTEETDKQIEKIEKVAEAQQRVSQTYSMDIQPLTKTELTNLIASQGHSWEKAQDTIMRVLSQLEDREGTYAPKSRDQYVAMIKDQTLLAQLRMLVNGESNVVTGNIPGFAEGGVGDFGSGTLAMLHGPEAIVPLDRIGSLGGIQATFYVNGTGQDVAKQTFGHLMNLVKASRQFGTV